MRVATFYFRAGVACILLAFMFTVVAAYGVAAGVADAPLAGTACAILFLVPGIVFIMYRSRSTALERRLGELADVLRGYREVTMIELAEKLGVKPEEAELLVAACIGRGFVKGELLAGEGKFVSAAESQPPKTQG